MSREKQIEKVPKRRQDYLKFKPFADDLREAESWCELDGVLNRYQTVKNLSKMGYRKASEVAREIFEEIDKLLRQHRIEFDMSCVDFYFEKHYAELKKKYTVTDTNVGCKDTEDKQ